MSRSKKRSPLRHGMVVSEFGNYRDKILHPSPDDEQLLTDTDKRMLRELGKGGREVNNMILAGRLSAVSGIIASKHGKMLLNVSRQFCKILGRTWIFCRIDKNNWINESEPLKVQATMTDNIWASEPNRESLEFLYKMDVEHEFMLSFEIYEPSDLKTLIFFSHIVKPDARLLVDGANQLYKRGIEFKLVTEKLFEKSEKWVCQGCFGAKVGNKLKKCSSCLYARYCSASCQRLDWTHHKTTCSILGKLRVQDENRNGEQT